MAARTAATRTKRPTRPRWVRRVKLGIAFLTILILAGIIAFAVFFASLFREAEQQMGTLEERMETVTKPPSKILSADNKLLFKIATENRIPIKLSMVPKHVQQAMLAAEDKRFYDHGGFDLIGLGRAVGSVVKDQRVSQGGSTLTMQLAKQMYSGSQRTMERKLRDIAIATAMEQRLTKEQILELYLNWVYFGEGAHGIGAAAQVYFNKQVGNLSLAEACMLARCVRRPSADNPIADYDRSLQNKKVVLGIMKEEGMITEPQYQQALGARPKLNPNPPRTTASLMSAPYFVQHVIATLKRDMPEIDLKGGGYRIETTIDTRLQKVAEEQVKRVVRNYRRMGVTTGAFVVMDSEGRILCEVGGIDYNTDQYNEVFQGARQPGSAFKPFVYAAALASGAVNFGDSVSNEKRRYWDAGSRTWYMPKNGGRDAMGDRISMETALKYSVNRAAVNTLAETGISTVVGYARDAFGFPGSRFRGVGPSSYSYALGTWPVSPLELAEAYSVFATGGDRVQPRPIIRVIGPDGEIIKRYEPVVFRNVLDSGVVSAIDGALHEVVEGGTGKIANIVPDARGKTGTTQQGRDAWFCGYTDGLVGIGWIANYQRVNGQPKYLPMPQVYGGKITVQIWAGIMKEAQKRFAQKPAPVSDEPAVAVDSRPEEPVDTAPVAVDPEPQVPTDENTVPEPVEPGPVEPGPQPANTETTPPVTPPREESPRRRERPRDERPKDERTEQTVEVEVCADTGMRASLYCPETVPREFPRGKAPRTRCTLHGRDGGF